MAMHLVTGYAGKEHVTAANQGSFYSGIIGTGKYVLNSGSKFSREIMSSNVIRIHDGDLINQGRHMTIAVNDYVDVTIDNGLQSVKRNDIIVARYERNTETGVESASIIAIKGTSGDTATDPAITTGDILQGDAIDDFPLYRVTLNGINIESVTCLYGDIMSMEDLIEEIGKKAVKNHAAASTEYGIGSTAVYGHVRVTAATNIAAGLSGYALSASEKNPNVAGSLANQVAGKMASRAIDATSGGTSGSTSLITSGAVYSGLSGKANSSHSHSTYLPLSGGTMSGATTMNNNVYLRGTSTAGQTGNLVGINNSNNIHFGSGFYDSGDYKTYLSSGGDLVYRARTGEHVWQIGGSEVARLHNTSVELPATVQFGNSIMNGNGVQFAGSTVSLYASTTVKMEDGSGGGVCITGKTFRPTGDAGDGSITMGNTSYRFGQIYSTKSAISTSDKNAKHDIHPFDEDTEKNEKIRKFFLLLLPCSFMFYNGDRNHFGFISQDVEAALKEVGLGALDFGGFCKDQKVVITKDKNGNEIETVVEGEYIYSLRYEEFIALNTWVLQTEIKRNDELESRIAKIEEKLK